MVFLKKKKAPSELPELIIDKLEGSKKSNELSELKEAIVRDRPYEEKIQTYSPSEEKRDTSSREIQEKMKSLQSEKIKVDNEKAFFTTILNDINNELNNGKTIEEWYKNEFLPKDIVNEMKDYWGSQKKEIVIKSLGKNFKEKIETKIEQLKNMESEWQTIYFELIKKEEEIKKEENELKKIISEFVEMCNRRKDKTEDSENEK
jgi:hypothetical protein